MSCECPLLKWVAELSEEQDEEIEKFLNENENENN